MGESFAVDFLGRSTAGQPLDNREWRQNLGGKQAMSSKHAGRSVNMRESFAVLSSKHAGRSHIARSQTDRRVFRVRRARLTFSKISEARAVQMKGLGPWLGRAL